MQPNLEAARSGDRRRALEQVRDTLAAAIDGAVDRGDGTVAQLVAQYRATLDQLSALGEPERKATVLDELTARRKARDGDPADRSRATGRRKSGDG